MNSDRDQAPSGAGLIARGAEFHQQFLTRQLHRRQLATGAVWQGVALIAYGALVISSVDNLLRPLLVGKDTRMPDYLVLVSTLGGLAVFGVNGLVIGPVIAAMFILTWDLFTSRLVGQNDRLEG